MSSNTGQIDWTHWIYRLIALIIDSIIAGIPAYIIYAAISASILFNPGMWWFLVWGWLITLLLMGVISLLYYVILEIKWGATLGKRIMGLQVQTVDGHQVTFGKSFIRNITKILSFLIIIDWLVGIVTEGDKRQKFTDRMAGTTVVSTKQPFASSSTPPPPPPPPA
ncbi:MAG: RDD family protein [Candidatus Bathyarchaeota archaeon]|nr:RDD family protein [Candidatus Bathyarchaeota archaeon]